MLRGGPETIIGDVRDAAIVRAAIEDVDTVYHCAAAVGPDYSRDEIYAINFGGTHVLLDAVRQAGRGRVVLLSSINVLGTRNLDSPSEDLPHRRENEPRGDVKVDVEELALDYHRQFGLDVVILRMSLVYGPGDKYNIPKMLNTIRRGKFAYIGSRENVIPMVHADDAAQAVVRAGAASAAAGRIYHISDGAHTTAREFAECLAELAGCPPPQKVLPYFVPRVACKAFEWLRCFGLVKGPGPINRVGLRFLGTSRFVDIRRASSELGYAPTITFRHGMAATVRCLESYDHSR